MDESREGLINALGKHKVEIVVYSGKHGRIVVAVGRLDDPHLGVYFLATRNDGTSRKVSTLREALGFLQVPYKRDETRDEKNE